LISETSENVYWERVTECIVTFFGWSPKRAGRRVAVCRAQLEAEPDEEARVLIYHDEPFYVARDLAGGDRTFDLDDPERSAAYDAILDRTRVAADDPPIETVPDAPLRTSR